MCTAPLKLQPPGRETRGSVRIMTETWMIRPNSWNCGAGQAWRLERSGAGVNNQDDTVLGGIVMRKSKTQSPGIRSQTQCRSWRHGQEVEPGVKARGVKDREGQELKQA